LWVALFTGGTFWLKSELFLTKIQILKIGGGSFTP